MSRIHLDLTPPHRGVEHRPSVCGTKIRYKLLKDAKKEGNRLAQDGPDPITVYRCQFCAGYHVGKATRTILARLQLVKEAP